MDNELIKQRASERISTGILNVFQNAQNGAAAAFAPITEWSKSWALGLGVRACQLYFVVVLAAALAYAFATNPGDFAYDFSLVHGFVTAALCTVCIWLFQKHAREARTFGIAAAVACVVLSVTDAFLFGAFDVVAGRLGTPATIAILVAQYLCAAAVVFYLATSVTARYVLDQPLDRTPTAHVGHSFDAPLKQRVRTWPFWRDLGIYFIVFSFAGHWAEMLFCYNIYLGVFMGDVDFSEVMLWHQWLFPYFAEGVAVVLIVVLLTPVKEWLLKKFGGRVLPAVLVSTLTDEGKTTCGPYSLLAPFYVAGKEYYAFMLECRNSSNTAQNLIKHKKCVINFLDDDRKTFKEMVRLGWPGDTPAEKMKDFAFHLENGLRKAEDPKGTYPKVISEALQAVECTWVDTLDGAQDDGPLPEGADHYELEKYHDFNGITSPYGAHFVLRIDKILMKPRYRDAIVNGVRAQDFPPLPVDYGYRDSKNFWYHKHRRLLPELLPQRQTTVQSVRYAANRLQTDVQFTDAALEKLVKVPRIFLPTVLKGCVSWAEENNVKLIDVEQMDIINDKRSKEKNK